MGQTDGLTLGLHINPAANTMRTASIASVFSCFVGSFIFAVIRSNYTPCLIKRSPTLLAVGRAQLISRKKMSNFTAVFGKNATFHGNFTEGYLLFFEPPKSFTCTDT